MVGENREKTLFITDQRIYCYNVMPFELKNFEAIFQRSVNKVLFE